MKINRNMDKQRGIGLLEIILAIGIIAVVVVVVLGQFTSANIQSQATNETRNLQTINNAVKQMFNGRTNFTGLTTQMVINSGGFPTQMVNGANVTHSWQGAVTTAPLAPANTSFDITYAAVPTAACIALVNQAGNTFRTVTVNAVVVKALNAQVDPVATDANCSAAATVPIIFNNA